MSDCYYKLHLISSMTHLAPVGRLHCRSVFFRKQEYSSKCYGLSGELQLTPGSCLRPCLMSFKCCKEPAEEASSWKVREDWPQREQWGSRNWKTWREVGDGVVVGWPEGGERTQAGSAPLAGAAGGRGGRHYPLVLLILEGSVPWWGQGKL